MLDQTMINWILAVFSSIIGFLISTLWKTIKELRDTDMRIMESIHSIDKLIAGNYVTRDRMELHIDAMFKKLDRIENKLDLKADLTYVAKIESKVDKE